MKGEDAILSRFLSVGGVGQLAFCFPGISRGERRGGNLHGQRGQDEEEATLSVDRRSDRADRVSLDSVSYNGSRQAACRRSPDCALVWGVACLLWL